MNSNPIAEVTSVDGLVVIQRRHLGRWAAGSVIMVLIALLLNSVARNPRFRWSIVKEFITSEAILRGLGVTLMLTAVAMVVGMVLGVVIAVMRLSVNPVVRGTAFGYVSFFRGTPVLVQLLFWYNLAALYPVISFGIPGVALNANRLISPIMAAILGLGLNEAAYMSEIIRAGIISVDHGQSEAAGALGLTRLETMRRITLPQAMRVIVPPTGNELIGMLKTTSLVSVVSVPDLLYSSQLIYARNFATIPLLIVASIWYLVVTTVLSIGQFYVERRYARGQRNLPMTPWQRLTWFVSVHSPISHSASTNSAT
jgi:polar amino acid transport system permease protein